VPGKVPTIEQLSLGEVAINTYDGKIFLKRLQEFYDEEISANVTIEDIISFAATVPVKNTLYVQKDGSDYNDGTTWNSAFLTIEKALEAAEARDGVITLIDIAPGTYVTRGNLDMPDNTLIRAAHRSVFIRPEPGFEENNVIRMGSGCFVEGPVFEDWRLDSLEDPTVGFAISFRPGAVITRAPYAHKIVVRTNPYWTTIAPPLDRDNQNPLVGIGGGVILADGAVCSPYSVFPNIMAWGATPVTHNGIGYVAKNGGLINAVNAVSMWCHKHFYAIDGGQIILSACSSQFGDYTMVAKGTRQLILPDEPSANLVIDTSAYNEINASANTIIDNMWNDLVSEGYTAGWSADYETLTRRDAASFLQAMGWTLQSGNDKPMQDFTKGLFDTQGNLVFEPSVYDYDKIYSEFQKINDAIAHDVLFDSNVRTITAATAFYRASNIPIITFYKDDLLYALNEHKDQMINYMNGDQINHANYLFDELIAIIDVGLSEVDAKIINDPPDYDSGFYEARRLLLSNTDFIKEEIISWIADQVASNTSPFSSGFTYDSEICKRDVGYLIDALEYDLTYGGNLATYDAASAYFIGTVPQYGPGEKEETIAAFIRLRSIVSDIMQGVLITPSSGNALSQDDSGTPGSSTAAAFASARLTEIIATLTSDGTLPTPIEPDPYWVDAAAIAAHDALKNNERTIANEVIRRLMEYSKTLLGAFLYSFENMRDQIIQLPNVSEPAKEFVVSQVEALISTLIDPVKVNEPSTITAIGHTWTAIMAGVALTKIPPARNFTTIAESILELEQGLVIASGQDDQGSALFIGGMEINSDTGELTGPPFEKSVNRIATRTAIARSF
jgi:hypothetical protein